MREVNEDGLQGSNRFVGVFVVLDDDLRETRLWVARGLLGKLIRSFYVAFFGRIARARAGLPPGFDRFRLAFDDVDRSCRSRGRECQKDHEYRSTEPNPSALPHLKSPPIVGHLPSSTR
ncbi:MAG TPA: hypothetical protein VNS60_14520, partial [Solirubrobacterales bacterium]|nr:hypothetical protein [Solirubrobacterales bacterium]